jgi:predicted thioesterase
VSLETGMMERCASILASENLSDGKATVGFEVCVIDRAGFGS